VVSRAEIAKVVQEVMTGEGFSCYGLVPGEMCLSYAATGAMMAHLASGQRYAVQIGGFAVHDLRGRLMWSYGPGWGREVPKLQFHTWFTAVPPGADAEMLWAMPPWAQVCDLSMRYFDSTARAVADSGRGPLPAWIWDSRTAVRKRLGIMYKPQRAVTMRVLEAALAPAAEGEDDLATWLDYAAGAAADCLGLQMGGMTPLVPGSFLVGHPSREMVPGSQPAPGAPGRR